MNKKLEDELMFMQSLLNQESVKAATRSLFSKQSLDKSISKVTEKLTKKQSTSPNISMDQKKIQRERISNVSPRHYNLESVIRDSTQCSSSHISGRKSLSKHIQIEKETEKKEQMDSNLNDSFQSIDNFIKTRTIIVSDDELDDVSETTSTILRGDRSRMNDNSYVIRQEKASKKESIGNMKSDPISKAILVSETEMHAINFATFTHEDSLIINKDIKLLAGVDGSMCRLEDNVFAKQYENIGSNQNIAKVKPGDFTFTESTVLTENKEVVTHNDQTNAILLSMCHQEEVLENCMSFKKQMNGVTNAFKEITSQKTIERQNSRRSVKATSPIKKPSQSPLPRASLQEKKLEPKIHPVSPRPSIESKRSLDLIKTAKPYQFEEKTSRQTPKKQLTNPRSTQTPKQHDQIEEYFARKFGQKQNSCNEDSMNNMEKSYRSQVKSDPFVKFRDEKLKNLLSNFL